MNNCLSVLAESLDMKLEVLLKIKEYTDKQKAVFEEESPDIDEFDSLVDDKDVLVDKLISLDDGFERLYQDISNELSTNRSKYSAQIKQLQDKIGTITELSASIQAQESRNKKMIEDYFAKERQGIKKNRVNSKAAYDYYRNMTGINVISSGFMDEKN